MNIQPKSLTTESSCSTENPRSNAYTPIEYKAHSPISKMLFEMLEAMQKERAAERRG